MGRLTPVSIGRKLVLLLLLSIVLVLTLVGISLDYIVRQYHNEHAQDEFSRVFRHVVVELDERQENLAAAVADTAANEQVTASMSMIHGYARPDAYEPAIFDSEKQNLAGVLRAQVHGRELGQMAVYDSAGLLTAFYEEDQGDVSGIVSYEPNGRPVLLTRAADRSWQHARNSETVNLNLRDPDHGAAQPALRFYRFRDGFAIEAMKPVVRRYANRTAEQVGHVHGVEFLRGDFVAAVSARSDVNFAMVFDDGTVVGQVKGLSASMLATVNTLDKARPNLHTNVEHPDYFIAAAKLPLDERKSVYLVAAVEKAMVLAQVKRSQRWLLLVLVLSALIIVPTGAWAARRVISEPVDHLLEGAKALSHGDLARRVTVTSKDELGCLARAFNNMAEALERRQNALAESEARYRTLMDSLPLSVFYKDANSVYRSCNLHYAEDRGLRPEEVIGKTDYDLYPQDLAERYRDGDRALLASKTVLEFEEPNVQQGKLHIVHTTKAPVWDAIGRVVGVLGIYYDVTERNQAEERLRQAAAVFESTAEGVLITDANRVIIAVNSAFTRITGYTGAEVLGMSPAILRSDRQGNDFFAAMWCEIERTGSWQGEIWNRRKNGEVHPEWMTISVVRNASGQVINYVGVFSDITVIKHSQDQLDYLAHHDPLTDLPNRLLFAARLQQAMERTRRSGGKVAVLFLDLDRFKYVNDTLGHPTGDTLLQHVAERLKACLRASDTVARLGGDEFVVTLEQAEDQAEVVVVAKNLIDSLSEPFVIEGNELHLGASVGISLFPQDGEDVATLVKNADAAMFLAKEQGRNTYRFFTTALGVQAEERFHLEGALRHALERNELELFYQPQVELHTGRIVGAEALLRWRHAGLGLIPPDRFIPLAEETGLIIPIGEWVLLTACQQLVAWWEQGHNLGRISVNLSGLQIQRGDLVATVAKVLTDTGVEPRGLELEITESVIMQHPERAAVILDGLRELGVELAIDDFGTGYSSLSYLKRFPLDNLKIDKSFVSDIPNDANDAAIIRAVIALAENLQLRVTAEGVETEEQRQFLLMHACHAGQGYLFSRPLPMGEFEALMATMQPLIEASNGTT